jgi:predicted RNA-binding Zn-ribbon protein involved in translation (DUF1610 family)
MGLLTRLFGNQETTATAAPAPAAPVEPEPVATGQPDAQQVEDSSSHAVEITPPSPTPPKAAQDAPVAVGVTCPECGGEVTRTKGSPVSPYIDQYHCVKCDWRALTCGSSGCDGYLTPEEMGYANTVRYNCVTCGWTGTGTRY